VRALILVDLQNDFLLGGSLAVPDGNAVIDIANAVQPRFPLIVCTQDWHPADHLSFASQHPGRRPGDQIELAGLAQTLWADHCVQDTRGAEFVPGLDRQRVEAVFQKGTDRQVDSYSAFFDNAHRRDTGLGNFLKDRGVDEVWLLGLATDYCVRFSADDALSLGFRTHVIEDGCRAVDLQPGDGKRALAAMSGAGAKIVHARDAPRRRTLRTS
jgi:nicotinamidase/pyrazinamidase